MDDNQADAAPCYIEQKLKIPVPNTLWTRLVYGDYEVRSVRPPDKSGLGFVGVAAEVKYSDGTLAGTLVYYPGVSRKLL